jgi:uncharacterized membrane protein YdbT with pleckstrin-like domain
MAYYKKVLQPDESVKYVGKLHWVMYRHAILLAILAAIPTLLSSQLPEELGPILTVIFLLLAALSFLSVWFTRVGTEIVVTNKRVIHKVGWLSRQTQEMNITKVETVDVDQSLTGRVLGFGAVSIRGIGGSWEPLRWIARPLEMRNAVIVG